MKIFLNSYIFNAVYKDTCVQPSFVFNLHEYIP